MLAVYAEALVPTMVKLLIRRGATVNTATRDGQTAIMRALNRGRTEIVQTLISAGAQVLDAELDSIAVPKPAQAPDVRTAVERSVALLQRTDRQFFTRSGCRSCHNQALPAMVVKLAGKQGFRSDAAIAREQFSSVRSSLVTQKSKALQMMDPDGGTPQSSSYMLLAYDLPADD